MMKKMICILIVLALCLPAIPVLASEEGSSLMDRGQELLDSEDYDAAIPYWDDSENKNASVLLSVKDGRILIGKAS